MGDFIARMAKRFPEMIRWVFDPQSQLPQQLSTGAENVDYAIRAIYWISLAFFVAIIGTMVFFVYKYRRREGVKAEPTGHATALEIFWTAAPLILLVWLFYIGFRGYVDSIVAPDGAVEVRVRGMQWQWEFEHASSGVVENGGILTVPVDTPVKLVMSSQDVIHSFFIPAFRAKRDVVPGMYSTLWFEATEETGDNPADQIQVFCAEYCGAPEGTEGNAGHSAMYAKIKVVSKKAYDKLMADGPPPPASCEGLENESQCWGEALYAKSGCTNCHAIDGATQTPAPNFKGLWGRVEQLSSGETITVLDADGENYIRESILMPQAKIVKGYEGVNMPPFRFSDRQIDALIAYIKSMGSKP